MKTAMARIPQEKERKQREIESVESTIDRLDYDL